MSEIERVIKVINWLIFEEIVSSRKDLAEKIGYTESSISQILNQKVPLSTKFINKLSNFNPQINKEWILTGEGEMLVSSIIDNVYMEQTVKERLIIFLKYKKIGQVKFADTIGASRGFVANIRKSIQPDKIKRISECFPELNTGWLLTGEGTMLKEETVDHDNANKERIEDVIGIANDTVIHNRFLDVINSMNLSASDIKLRLGFNLEDIAQIIANRKEMTVKFLQVFCREFSVSSDYILNGIGQAVIERVGSNDALPSTYLAQNAKILSFIESMNNRITNVEERLDKVEEKHRAAI